MVKPMLLKSLTTMIPTHTTERVAGPEWGAGGAGVFFGFSGELAYGAILGHHWGENDFSVTTIFKRN